MTYNQAIEQLGNRDQKKIGNNTYLVRRDDDCVAIRLYATDILTFRPDDSVVVKTGGWYSATTKARINEHLIGPRIHAKRGTWCWFSDDWAARFADGDIIIRGRVTRCIR